MSKDGFSVRRHARLTTLTQFGRYKPFILEIHSDYVINETTVTDASPDVHSDYVLCEAKATDASLNEVTHD